MKKILQVLRYPLRRVNKSHGKVYSQRPPRPLRYVSVPLRWRFVLLSVGVALIIAVAAVFINLSMGQSKSAPMASNALVPTPTPIHAPPSTPIHTPTPIPTPTPTPIPTPTSMPIPPVIVPTAPPVPTPTPTPTPTQVVVPTCAGSGCDGKNPRNDHGPHGIPCWDDGAYVVANQAVKYGIVYLWYSRGCGTNWAETLQTGGTSYIANANITRSSDNRRYDSTKFASDVWTVMVYAPTTTAQACGSINNATGGCSGFH
jgi:hypothetical protein